MSQPSDPTTPDHEDVVPESEIARRRRVLELAQDCADLIADLAERLKETASTPELSISMGEFAELIVKNLPERMPEAFRSVFESGLRMGAGAFSDEQFLDQVRANATSAVMDPVINAFERAFDEAPKLTDASGSPVAGQMPAFEGAIVMKSGYSMQGAIGKVKGGGLKLLAKSPKGDQAVEYFFSYEDVEVLAIPREVAVTQRSALYTT